MITFSLTSSDQQSGAPDGEFWSVDYLRHELPTPQHLVSFEMEEDDQLDIYVEHPAECDADKGCLYGDLYAENFEPALVEGIAVDTTRYFFIATFERCPADSWSGFELDGPFVELLAELVDPA